MLFFTRKRIPILLALGGLLAALACLYGLYSVLRAQAEADMATHLLRQAELMAAMCDGGADRVKQPALEMLKRQHVRLSIMDSAGKITLETALSENERKAMDNHLNRPEIRQALKNGSGTSIRYSNTLASMLIYAAVPLQDDGALCLAVPQTQLALLSQAHLRGVLPYFIAFLLFPSLFIIAGVLIYRRYVSNMCAAAQQIAKGAYKRRLRFLPGEQFIPLAAAFNSMAKELARQKSKAAGRKERLQAVLNLVPDGVLLLTRDGRVRNYNTALEKLFPEFASSWGKPMLDLLPKLELQKALGPLFAPISADSVKAFAPAEGVLQLEHPEGRFFQVHYGLNHHGHEFDHTVLLDDGTQGTAQSDLGAVLVFTEVTLLLRLESVRRDFVANVSHELRTPLTAIQGYAETINSMTVDADIKRFSGIICKQSGRLGRLVDALLELARLESAGLLTEDDSETDAKDICQEVLQLLGPRASSAQVHFILDMPDDVRLKILPDQLFQVLENLLDNALRYSPANGQITIRSRPATPGFTEIQVQDQGCGIQEGEQERIFERFFKGRTLPGQSCPPATKVEEKIYSTGLGLAICKHIVELYGGSIRAANILGGKGAVFAFTLPAAKV